MLSTAAIYLRIICILFLAEPYVASAQLDIWSSLENLHLEFSERDNRKIERINKQKEIADNLTAQASGTSDPEVLEEAFNELFAASYALYDIYHEYCVDIRKSLPSSLPPELDRPVLFEQRAQEYLDKSEVLKSEAKKAEDPARAEHLFLMAHDLELIALLSKARALRIYQDFPVIYSYEWEDDITILREEPEKVVRKINDAAEEEVVVEELAEESIYETKGITFIVQIAAHTEEIPQSELNAIYGGNEKIKMMQEEGWYKYYLGPFRNFEEASEIMKILKSDTVFIAAYYDGERISVNEGRRMQSQQPQQ